MKNLLLKSCLIITLITIGLTSCKKDDVDPRDQYVGSWQSKNVGNLTLYLNGKILKIVPINKKSTINVVKSSENKLMIGQTLFTINGNKLTSNPKNQTENKDGINIIFTTTSSGHLGSNIITINSSTTGTWSTNSTLTGNLKGSLSGILVTTLSK